MGKKIKKGRAAPKEKRAATHPVIVVPRQCGPSVEVIDGVSAVKERRSCPHLDKGFDLGKLSEKIGSSEPIRCEDCGEGAAERRGSKGKGKHGKKKGSGTVDSKSESKALWICLECGNYACGGVGLPTTPQSHAVRHARQTRHPIAIQLENPHLRWCFPCSTLIPVEKMEDNGEQKDFFSDVVKLIKGCPSERSPMDVEEVWFGGGSVTSEIKLAGTLPVPLQGEGGYVARGLVNLGNTCFFNSVVQNLLAIDMLRDYFLTLDPIFGPLTISLKKLYAETKPEAGLKNSINPRSLFGCVCSKAPQFRGYQQHDGHELLRCLLDALSTEELGAKKQMRYSEDYENSSDKGRSFVNDIFMGKISSTVSCLECGHSSTVCEPFLDLSLPVPTKKPPSTKAQLIFRGKKPKLPPKRSGRVGQKANKYAYSSHTQCVSNSSTSAISESSCVADSSPVLAPASDSTSSDAYCATRIADRGSSASQNLPAVEGSENEQVFENKIEQASPILDNFTWMDYLEPEIISVEQDPSSENNDSSVIQDLGINKNTQNNILIQSNSESDIEVCSLNRGLSPGPQSSPFNSLEDELPLLVQDSEVLLLPYKEESSTTGEIVREEVEASSLVAGCEQEEMDFDGIGDLFNEPDVSGPLARPSLSDDLLQSKDAETSFIAANISESDPDEVDNSDSPVSVESCLAHFIKPECLSNENAWHCDNCSKTVRRQRLDAKEAECPSHIPMNGAVFRSESYPQSLRKEISYPVLVMNHSNEDVKRESSVSHNGKVDCMNQNCTNTKTDQMDELNPVVSPVEGKCQMEDACQEIIHSFDSNGACHQAIVNHQVGNSINEPCISGNNTDEVQHHESQMLIGESESDEVEGEEIDSKSVRVMRDATKRVLIDKAPRILTIHLKRFSQDARGRLSKLNGYVKFGETLDLRPYINPRSMDNEKYEYSLTGVVEHSGTMRGGHYVAYVRGGVKGKGKTEKENGGSVWYHVSDAHVRQVSMEVVLRREAYILFYERN